MTIPVPPGGVRLLTRAGLLMSGLSDNTIRRALGAGRLTTVLPGLYAPVDPLAPPDAVAAHSALAHALLPRLAPGSVISHQSAAALHGLAVPPAGPAPVHVTRPPPSSSRRGSTVCVHRGRLDADELVRLDGLPVTSPARTVVDCATTMGTDDAVRLARAAVDAGLVGAAQVEAALRRRHRVPGIRLAASRLAGVTLPS